MVTGQAVSRPRTDEQGAGKTTHMHVALDHTGAGAQGPMHASTRPIGADPLRAKACCRSGRSGSEKQQAGMELVSEAEPKLLLHPSVRGKLAALTW